MQIQLSSFTFGIVVGILLLFAIPLAAWSMPLTESAEIYRLSGGGDNIVRGRIREAGVNVPNITVRLFNNNNVLIQTVTTGEDGIYTFTNIANGIYTVRPESPNYTFDPEQRSVTVFFNDVMNQDFTAIPREYDVSGRIVEDGNGLSNIIVRLYQLPNTTNPIQSVVTNSQGNFVFSDVVPGNYRVTPENFAYTFVPTFREFSVSTKPVELADFQANLNRYDIRGRVSDNGAAVASVTMTLALASAPTTILQTDNTDGNGNYAFGDVEPGTYRVTPSLKAYLFVPDYRDVIVTSGDVNNVDFEANSTLPTATPTRTPTVTNTPPPGATFTPTSTATRTPTVTNTPPPGATFTPTATSTPSVQPESVYVPFTLKQYAFATPAPTPTPAPTCNAIDREPNNLYIEADNNLPLCLGGVVNGVVSRTNDVNDIYRIEVEEGGGAIQVALTNLPNGADYDLYLDAGPGNNLAFSTNAGSANEMITFTVAPGRYYIRVVARQDGNPNSYQLRWTRP